MDIQMGSTWDSGGSHVGPIYDLDGFQLGIRRDPGGPPYEYPYRSTYDPDGSHMNIHMGLIRVPYT